MFSHSRLIAQGRFDAAHRIGPISWPWFDILYIQTGEVTIAFLDEPAQRMKAGQAVLIYPDTPFVGHALTETSDAAGMHFELQALRRKLPAPVRWIVGRTRGYRMYSPRMLPMLDRDLARMLLLWRGSDSPARTDMLDAGLLLILGGMENATAGEGAGGRADAAFFTPLLDWMGRHLADNVTLAQMAQRIALSPSHFRSRFRNEMGMSPGQYFLELRTCEAQRLLRETNEPIKQIARSVGYRQVSHFYRAFNRLCEETPHRYRGRHRLRG